MKKFKIIILLVIVGFCLATDKKAAAQNDKITLTIRPPLIKLNMDPGGKWQSFIEVVNSGSFPVKVRPQARDYISDENGKVIFWEDQELDAEAENKYLLSRWITIADEAREIPAGQSIQLPYSIELPQDISPGGHYAAIMIGTVPENNIQGSGINVSSMMTSLIMLKVRGEVAERGRIAAFKPLEKLSAEPRESFEIQFENLGNIHLLPRGDIRIFNMFGKETGVIPINQNSDSGNVFPESKRKWIYEWSDDPGLTKMGKYKAVLALNYGEELKQSDSRTAYFWVIDFKLLGLIAGLFVIFIALVVLSARYYIRKTVLKAQKEIEMIRHVQLREEGKTVQPAKSRGRPRKNP